MDRDFQSTLGGDKRYDEAGRLVYADAAMIQVEHITYSPSSSYVFILQLQCKKGTLTGVKIACFNPGNIKWDAGN